MTASEEKEIWEFQRKSFVHWRRPYLPDDPFPFMSRDKQRLNHLHQYRLNLQYSFPEDSAWTLHKDADHSTDAEGWIYSDHFQSRKWSKNQFSKTHLCRKRVWKRMATKQFVAKMPSKQSSNQSIDVSKDSTSSSTVNVRGSQIECIIHEVEVQSASKWKAHQNGWFDQEMKSMSTISSPYDIKLSSLPSSSSTKGVWKWCEGWKCIDPEFKSNDKGHPQNAKSNNNNNGDSALYETEFVKLESLRYMKVTPMTTMNVMRPSTSIPSQQGRPVTPTPTGDNMTVSDYEEVTHTEDGTFLTISADVTEDEFMTDDDASFATSPAGNGSGSVLEVAPKKKKKKKRIRIRKNAKKLLKKMKSTKNTKDAADPNNKDTASNNTSTNGNGDTATNTTHSQYPNGFKVPNGGILSAKEERELHELFTQKDRGWCYAQRFSRDDSEWKPQNHIITKCNYRRRTWVRCAIFDALPGDEVCRRRGDESRSKSSSANVVNGKRMRTKKVKMTEDGHSSRGSSASAVGAAVTVTTMDDANMSTGDHLKASITRTKSKANDLIAMIDGVLTGQGPPGMVPVEYSGSGYELNHDASFVVSQ